MPSDPTNASKRFSNWTTALRTVVLLNLVGTKIVNSIGISFLIEIIEKMLEIHGKLAFCNLTPTIEKTFNIMGLTQYADIYANEEEAVGRIGSA